MSSDWRTISYQSTCSDPFPKPAMSFEPVEIPDDVVEEYDKQGRRWYVQNGIRMASITTILKETDREGQLALQEWRDRVGYEVAQQISDAAADLGTRWHNFCEHYVMGEDVTPYITQPGDWERASALAHMLNHQIVRVWASESKVAKPNLIEDHGAAGRMDMLVELRNGKLGILDFKTGKKAKTGNRLRNYGVQATFYASTVSELISRPVETIIIAQLNEHEYLWQTSTPALYLDELKTRVADFYRRMPHEDN